MKEIKTKVSGTSFDNRQPAIAAHGKKGRKLLLVAEPDNPVNPKAVAVYIERKRLLGKPQHYHIGYLNGRLADDIQKAWADGKTTTATIMQVTGGTKDKPNYGVNVSIKIK